MYKVVGMGLTRAFRVLWALEELGLEYEHDPAPPGSDTARALNPSGKVPILLDGETKITDSTAILTYLADKHGGLTHPAGTRERARQDALMHAFLDEIEGLLWVNSRHAFILPEDRRVPAIRPSLEWEYDRNIDRLAGRFVGPYLSGDQMTIADIVATHCLNWAHAAKFPTTNPVFKAYSKEMRNRPAFMQAQAKLA